MGLDAGTDAGRRVEAGPHDAAPSDAPAAAHSLLAGAQAVLTQTRPRFTVDPGTPTYEPDAATAWWPITGKVTFHSTPTGVDLSGQFLGCRGPILYPVIVYAGADCATITASSQPWDDTRGIVSKVFCLGAPGARLYYTRLANDEKPWTLGGADSTNLIGRTIAVHDPETHEPLACGSIEVSDDRAPPPLPGAQDRPSSATIAELSGMCLLSPPQQGPDGRTCPDRDKLAECVVGHCIADCLPVCKDHVACIEAEDAPVCATACAPEGDCALCLEQTFRCTLGYCRAELACAPPPTPGGPCSEFKACCMRQGPATEACLEYEQLLEQLSGDPSCLGALTDWDVNTNFTYRSPCYPDGGVPGP